MNNYIGYIRVSTAEQNLDLQRDALKKYNCIKIFSEYESGTKEDRSQLQELFKFIRPKDILVIWKLDRLARSIQHLIQMVNELNKKKIQLISDQENIDTTTPTGRLTFHIFAAIAEFERDVIHSRTMAGLAAARARGRKGGRPKTTTDYMIKKARKLYDSKQLTVKEICDSLGITRGTFYNYVDIGSGKDKNNR